MIKHQEIISNLKYIDAQKAEYLEEEIDIIVHKLKFLTTDNFPKTILLNQKEKFKPIDSDILVEKVKIAGGQYINNLAENPDCIIILQATENLYSELPELLNNELINSSGAYSNNNIFIIQDDSFNTSDNNYLQDTEILAEILQPKYFIYGHDGKAWIKFELQ